MRYSGHTKSFINNILERVVKRYDAELSNHLEDRKPMYRSRLERIRMKEQTKVSSLRDTWFRSGGYTSTLTVPAERVKKSLEKSRQPA